jgi:hypothetical protein
MKVGLDSSSFYVPFINGFIHGFKYNHGVGFGRWGAWY